MKQITCLLSICLAVGSVIAQPRPADSSRRLLVVSGGGARGAWGAGVISSLVQREGGYQAVFGTSTGSLMAPLILLGDMDLLDTAYTHVNQNSIFNKSPFHVDSSNGTVKTSLNFRAVWRFIFGYKTFGVTKNLFKTIQSFLTQPRYDSLINLYRQRGKMMAVAVTNTRTGALKIIYDSIFHPGITTDYDTLCRWIWASADEPLYMSYVSMRDTAYVDGGVREVIPIQDGLQYAITHDIDTVDVVINNSLVPIDQDWNYKDGGILYGLERLLGIYDLGIVQYNENYASLLLTYYNAVGNVPPPGPAPAEAGPHELLYINFYCMPPDLAATYQNELGFVQSAMHTLLLAGKQYGADPSQNCFTTVMKKSFLRSVRRPMPGRPNP
ncbi:MAG TPA: patatin-like phospholipase family protein [Puia sp.]|nr:patatin-like phospholipase family protein [Puia sp.]